MMKKITLSLIATVTLGYSNFTFSSCIENTNQKPCWTGFYVGANAGYWWSQKNNVVMSGSSSFINQTFALGAGNIANALAQLATNNYSLHTNGFIGGGEVGYNYQYSKRIVWGIDADVDGLTNANNTFSLQKTVNLVDFSENYVGSLVAQQRINYLGTMRARLGYLFCPNFLVYVAGGFAYGNVTLNAAWIAQESLGPVVLPAIDTRNNFNKTLAGWTVGGGAEWFFKPHWSAKLEYTYYTLNNLNAPITLAQMNASFSPATLWGSAAGHSKLSLAVGTIKVGINYHFA